MLIIYEHYNKKKKKNLLICPLGKHRRIIINVFYYDGNCGCGCLRFWAPIFSSDHHLQLWPCLSVQILLVHLGEDPAFGVYVEEVGGGGVGVCAGATDNLIVDGGIFHVVKVISDDHSNHWAVVPDRTKPT